MSTEALVEIDNTEEHLTRAKQKIANGEYIEGMLSLVLCKVALDDAIAELAPSVDDELRAKDEAEQLHT